MTDGFTGNVALKSLEGALGALFDILGRVINTTPETRAAGEVLGPELLVYAQRLDPEETGGAMLLGVDGVCVISHGSSSSRAILNAVRVAARGRRPATSSGRSATPSLLSLLTSFLGRLGARARRPESYGRSGCEQALALD